MPATQTYKSTGIVLRKTKLGEKDLIVTFVTRTGELARAVAKGARKPGGSFASKLELFSEVDFMASRGRSLDVITDARFADGVPRKTYGLEQSACASAIADLLSYACQEGLEQPRLYDMAREAFRVIADAQPNDSIAVTAAALIKIVSLLGFRPNLNLCSSCGEPIDIATEANVLFSLDGGAVCESCAREAEGTLVSGTTLGWSAALLRARFVEVVQMNVSPDASFSVLQLMQTWITHHIGKPLKSLTYLFTCGLF
jgi:DNA repair protein RecO (recombination protein O)